MKDTIQRILEAYPSARANTPFKGSHEISTLFNSLKDEFAALSCVAGNPNLIVKASYGKGNWAAVPWVAVLDTRETSTTQNGTYIVLLFKEDGEGCYLKIGQGVTEVSRALKARAPEELRKRAEDIRARFADEEGISLEFSGEQHLDTRNKLASLYEASTIYSKYFLRGQVPEDDALERYVEILARVYEKFVVSSISANPQDVDEQKRVWAISAGEGGSYWEEFLASGQIAIGWEFLGDLSQYSSQQDVLDAIARYRNDDSKPSNDALCCYQFCAEMKAGDIVVAKIGRKKILGMGVITSDYIYDDEIALFKSRRTVNWLKTEPAEFPGSGTTTKTLTEISAYPRFVSVVNEYLGLDDGYDSPDEDEPAAQAYGVPSIVDDGCFLPENNISEVLDRLRSKRNIILQGPPGTGKTWLAKRLGYALIGNKNKAQMRVVQFHANLAYEDFVRGFRPTPEGKLALVDGAFMEAIEDARNTTQPIVFVIEEINRGNTAQIFGEMLTLIETDKRNSEEAMELTYRRSTNERVYVPANLYIIGTMNIADRSLAMVDLALRRRFSFVDLKPCFNEAWRSWLVERLGFSSSLVSRIESAVDTINKRIASDTRLGSQYMIGHSYFTPSDESVIRTPQEWYVQVVHTEIAPLLNEYWYDDSSVVDELIAQALRGM